MKLNNCSLTFNMKDLGEASFVLGIEIHRNRSCHLLELSLKHILSIFLKDLICKVANVGRCLLLWVAYLTPQDGQNVRHLLAY